MVFARAGYHVSVYDPSPTVRDGVLGWAETALRDLNSIGLVTDPAGALSNITVVDTMKAAVEDAIYVQESVFETVELKSAVSLEIDRHLSPARWSALHLRAFRHRSLRKRVQTGNGF